MFLNIEVLKRPLRTSRYKQERRNANGEEIQQTLSYRTIQGYTSAIASEYKRQKDLCMNSHPDPNGVKVKAVLKDRLRKENERKKREFVDRAAGTLAENYDREKISNFVRHCWTAWKDQRGSNQQSIEAYFRTACDFLLGHSMLLRGESRRMVELADLFSLDLENEGPTPCSALVIILNNGKTNQFSRIEYGAAVRSKNIFLCPLSHVSFYLFYRWNIMREPLPHFQQRHRWYQTHVIKGQDIKRCISYDIQL